MVRIGAAPVGNQTTMPTMHSTYSANITAGALRVRECRMLAPLVAQGASAEEWDRQVIEDNILQSANPASARRL